jgi:hypothetical protein
MGMLAVRISGELKNQMGRVPINWSEYLRKSIEEVLASKKKHELIRRLQKLQDSVSRPRAGTAARIIRKIRAHA